MNIGEKIRKLRKRQGVTQEQLADYLSVSVQAVSKWETGGAAPDVGSIPAIAEFFGVSIDFLFGFERKHGAEVEKICGEAYKHRKSDPERGGKIIKEGLEKYPNDDVLLANLLYTIDYSEKPDEVVEIAGKIVRETEDDGIKYDALRFSAYAYNAKGDERAAAAALEEIPELYFTKIAEEAHLFKGKAKYDAAEKQKWISFEILLQMIEETAAYFEAEHMKDAAKREYERGLEILNCMADEEKIGRFDGYKRAFNEKLT